MLYLLSILLILSCDGKLLRRNNLPTSEDGLYFYMRANSDFVYESTSGLYYRGVSAEKILFSVRDDIEISQKFADRSMLIGSSSEYRTGVLTYLNSLHITPDGIIQDLYGSDVLYNYGRGFSVWYLGPSSERDRVLKRVLKVTTGKSGEYSVDMMVLATKHIDRETSEIHLYPQLSCYDNTSDSLDEDTKIKKISDISPGRELSLFDPFVNSDMHYSYTLFEPLKFSLEEDALEQKDDSEQDDLEQDNLLNDLPLSHRVEGVDILIRSDATLYEEEFKRFMIEPNSQLELLYAAILKEDALDRTFSSFDSMEEIDLQISKRREEQSIDQNEVDLLSKSVRSEEEDRRVEELMQSIKEHSEEIELLTIKRTKLEDLVDKFTRGNYLPIHFGSDEALKRHLLADSKRSSFLLLGEVAQLTLKSHDGIFVDLEDVDESIQIFLSRLDRNKFRFDITILAVELGKKIPSIGYNEIRISIEAWYN